MLWFHCLVLSDVRFTNDEVYSKHIVGAEF